MIQIILTTTQITNSQALLIMVAIIFIFCAIFMTVFLIFTVCVDKNKRKKEEKRLKKMAELSDAFEAGREYQEYKGNANLEEKSWDKTFEKWYERTYNNKSKIW